MEYCPMENFNQLAEAIGRVERFLGLDNTSDPATLVGRIKAIASYSVASDVQAHRVVRLTATGVTHAENDPIESAQAIVGITLTGALAGEQVQVQSFGLLQGITATFDTSMSVILGSDGMLTQGPPPSGALVSVGRPISETELFVDISNPIFL